jgi:hypothetical protein
MTFRKAQDTGKRERREQFALRGELVLEQVLACRKKDHVMMMIIIMIIIIMRWWW